MLSMLRSGVSAFSGESLGELPTYGSHWAEVLPVSAFSGESLGELLGNGHNVIHRLIRFSILW